MASTGEEIGSSVVGLGIAGLVLASNFEKIRMGAMYSAGMELVTGHGNLPLFTESSKTAYQLGNKIIDPTTMRVSSATPHNIYSVAANDVKTAAAQRGISNTAYRSGLGSMVLPIGMTALFGAQAFYDGGAEALGRFVIEDTFANYYGNKVAERGGAKAISASGVRNFAGQANISSITHQQRYGTFLGSTLAGRMLPILGAYSGASMGFSAGQAIGEGLSGIMFGEENKTLGLAGGILGARGGAALGALAGKNIFTAVGTAFVVAGANMMTNAVGDILKTGFQNTRTRGLDFAGDLSSYNTNSAVTMRQRALQSMHKSHLNARSALGQEASYMHMNRDYFANYRRF